MHELFEARTLYEAHQTLLHMEITNDNAPPITMTSSSGSSILTHAAMGLAPSSLLMTCKVAIDASDGSTVEARALLDLHHQLHSSLNVWPDHFLFLILLKSARILGVAGLTHKSPIQSVTNCSISATRSSSKQFSITAVIVPRVTCDLPLHSVKLNSTWNHL